MTVQVGHDVVVTPELGQMYGRISIRCQCIDLRASIHKIDDALKAAIFGSQVQRGLGFGQLIWIGPVIEQQLHDVGVPTLVGGVEWCCQLTGRLTSAPRLIRSFASSAFPVSQAI